MVVVVIKKVKKIEEIIFLLSTCSIHHFYGSCRHLKLDCIVIKVMGRIQSKPFTPKPSPTLPNLPASLTNSNRYLHQQPADINNNIFKIREPEDG